MIKQLKNIIIVFFIFILLSFFIQSPILASNDVKTNSPSCILMDADSGNILYAKDAYKKLYPASTTKLMTAILVLENCNLSDIATVSHNAIFSVPVGYSHANLKEGEQLTIEQLLHVLLIPSANDAANVLAEHAAGSVQDFCKLMNQKAKDLGCKNTNFVNPNGIHNKNHYSTAYDLALIGKCAMNFPDIMRIAKVKQYTLPTTNKYDKTNRIFNLTNALINDESGNDYYYPYATGLKTGYTDYSGSCIVATAEKSGLKLIAVVLKSSSTKERYNDCKTLFNYGFDNYINTTLNFSGEIIETIEIEDSSKLNVAVKDNISALLKKNIDKNSLSPTIEINSDLKAPIYKNDVIGKISYTINDKVYSSELIADSYVGSGLEIIIFRILLIFLILYIVYQILKHISRDKPSIYRNVDDFKALNSKSNNSKKFLENNHHHTGKGEFKYKQIDDYL